MTSSKLGNDRGMKYRKARSKARAEMAQAEENDVMSAPVIAKKEILRALRRLIGVMLIVLAAALGGVLIALPAYITYTVVFVYICIQVALWWDLFA